MRFDLILLIVTLLFSISTYAMVKLATKKVVNTFSSSSDIKITPFAQKVYDACKKIPKGKVSTYASLATAIGSPKAVRAVGSALRRNPFAPKVPCHRVVASDLTIGGFYGSKDPNGNLIQKKIEMLKHEGVLFDSGMKVQGDCVEYAIES